MADASRSSSSDDAPLSQRLAAQQRRARDAAAPLAKKRKTAPVRQIAEGGTSSRAARSGRGSSAGLQEATGDFSSEYATIGVLGRGSFTEVNLLRHRQTSQLFVLKTCCKLDALSYAHLKAEAEAMQGVDHPLLIGPMAISSPPGRASNYSLLLPLCPGGDLLQLLRRQPDSRLPPHDTRIYCAMLTLGLAALHGHGLVYRDLKADNILVRADGYLALSDFGFTAKVKNCGKVKVGTTLYQAPEIVKKMRHGTAVDWWALGVLLLEMLTGESPFAVAVGAIESASGEAGTGDVIPAEDNEAIIEANILHHVGGVPARAASNVPSGDLSDFVSALLDPNPTTRLGSSGGASQVRAAAWLRDVDWAALEKLSLPPPHVPPPLPDDVDAALFELTTRCQSGFN